MGEAGEKAQILVKNGLLWVCSHTQGLTARGVLSCQRRRRKIPPLVLACATRQGWDFGKKVCIYGRPSLDLLPLTSQPEARSSVYPGSTPLPSCFTGTRKCHPSDGFQTQSHGLSPSPGASGNLAWWLQNVSWTRAKEWAPVSEEVTQGTARATTDTGCSLGASLPRNCFPGTAT